MNDGDVAGDSGGRRGTLRVYLGAAPGVGKTYAMLNEGCRAKARGVDVVVGFVETHGRARTREQLGDLDVMPRRTIEYRGTAFEEMDVDAILERRPERVLVDELAHTNVPGSRNAKRWQDVDELLAAGIDVISTVNIQHLESLNDVVERITGIRQRETIPDEVVRAADQVELVDQTPEALRRRMSHGNIYAPDKIDAALANYFRTGNLGALRELALLWVADKVDVGLEEYRERHHITEPWETRERVVVALTGAPGTEALIRRAARITQRAHGELLGVHILSDEGLAGPSGGLIEQHRRLLEEMGGEYHEVAGADIADALIAFATAENATQIVLGASKRSRWTELTSGSVVNRVVRRSGPIDVHVISHEHPEHGTTNSRAGSPARIVARSPIAPRRQLAGWVLAGAGVPLLTFTLAQLRDSIALPTVLLLFLALVVAVAATAGTLPAMASAIAAFLAANWYFTPPFYRWTVAEGENVIALVVFLGVAIVVSRFVDVAARRTQEAARARSTATTLARLAATMGDDDALPILLGHLRTAFRLDAAVILRRAHDGWQVSAADGAPIPGTPQDATFSEQLAPGVVLAVVGPRIDADDQLLLNAFAAQLATVLEHARLRGEAARAHALAEANELRASLLQAVSHDLRTPLASIKASVSSLRQPDIVWSPEDQAEFLHTIDDETDRLTKLVENLLDMSRINAGVLQPTLELVALDDVVAAALASLGPRGAGVVAEIPEDLPDVRTDAGLLERVLANIVDNAVRVNPPGTPVRLEAGARDDGMDVRVVDHGPGIPRQRRGDVFEPFQRLGDTRSGGGIGLGLAVAHGFASALGAAITIGDTPGGGTTMTVTVPLAR